MTKTAGEMQADADRAQIRRLVAMSDREREAFSFKSNRNMLRMMVDDQAAKSAESDDDPDEELRRTESST
jgi:hypothetical protein